MVKFCSNLVIVVIDNVQTENIKFIFKWFGVTPYKVV